MATVEVDVRDQIIAFKRKLAPNRERLKQAFADVKDHVSRAGDRILKEVAAGRPVVPELDYRDIRDGNVHEAVRQSIRSTGCVVVRGVVPADLASDWFAELGEYLETNRYDEREVEKRSLDKYFARSRQGSRRSSTSTGPSRRSWLGRIHDSPRRVRFSIACGSTKACSTPTCSAPMPTGRGAGSPGDKTLGLSPHMDAGTVERWIDPGYQQVYANIFAGDWRGYDPFDATYRLQTHESPSPAVCSMFRTCQGWTALIRAVAV